MKFLTDRPRVAGIETKVKANIAVELRDSLEQLCSNYPAFLAKLWPVFKQILTGDPVFTSASWEQVFKTKLADTFHFGMLSIGTETSELHT